MFTKADSTSFSLQNSAISRSLPVTSNATHSVLNCRGAEGMALGALSVGFTSKPLPRLVVPMARHRSPRSPCHEADDKELDRFAVDPAVQSVWTRKMGESRPSADLESTLRARGRPKRSLSKQAITKERAGPPFFVPDLNRVRIPRSMTCQCPWR